MHQSTYSNALEGKNTTEPSSSTEVKKAVHDMMEAFELFKKSNDERLHEIAKKGHADPLLIEKVSKLNDAVGVLEDINQKLTLQEQGRKSLQEQIDAVEAKTNRMGLGGNAFQLDQKDVEYKQSFDTYLRKDPSDLKEDIRKTLVERKALIAGNDTLGGYYLTPPEMQKEILKDIIEISPMRALASVRVIGGQSLKQPKRTGTFAARRVAETGDRTETTGYTTGMVEILAPEMYAEVHISEQMLEDSDYDLEAEMRQEFSEQFAVLEGAEFISGSGAGNEAEGILTNVDVGISTSGNATTITADGILNLYYDIKTAYARDAVYILNRSSIKTVRTLKDTTGQYLWMPGIANGAPNTINGAPYVEMPDMPDQGANAYPVAFGNFRRAYRIVDRVLLSVLRDPYTQSGNGKIRFLARKRTGGGVVLAQAIRKMKCAA